MKRFTSVIFGLILIAVGVIYILSAFGIADINFTFDGWWTLFIIVPCLNGLFTSRDKFGSAIGLAVGVLLLLAAQNVFDFDMVWKLIVPIIIILLGIKLIIKPTMLPKDSEKNAENDQHEYMSVFNSQTADFADEEISVAKVGAVFGGTKCNLTDAKIKDGSRLDIFCAFGGADIIVPEDVNVKINAFCLFGGISDKRENKNINKDSVTLNINGFCVFGGADIK